MTTQTIDLRIRVRVDGEYGDGLLLANDLREAWLNDEPLSLAVLGVGYDVEITRVSARDVEPEHCEDYGRNGDSWPGYEDDI